MYLSPANAAEKWIHHTPCRERTKTKYKKMAQNIQAKTIIILYLLVVVWGNVSFVCFFRMLVLLTRFVWAHLPFLPTFHWLNKCPTCNFTLVLISITFTKTLYSRDYVWKIFYVELYSEKTNPEFLIDMTKSKDNALMRYVETSQQAQRLYYHKEWCPLSCCGMTQYIAQLNGMNDPVKTTVSFKTNNKNYT